MERGLFTNNYLPGNKEMLIRFSLVFSVSIKICCACITLEVIELPA
jgi:hypothetical protein